MINLYKNSVISEFFCVTFLKDSVLRIIYCGDVVGRAGRDVVLNNLSKLRNDYKADVIIVNIENAAHGFGASPSICRQFLDAGVDALVTGNHVWQQRDLIPFLDECKKIVRPLNYPEGLPGRGAIEIELANGKKVLVMQLLGRLFMEAVDCPAQAADKVLKNYTLGKNINAIFVDIHAEATAEKIEVGHYLDGRVSAVIGSHTHIPTSDFCIRDGGTAYQTDVGMCGDYNSVIGFDKTEPVNRLIRKYTGGRLTPAKGPGTLFGVMIDVDDKTGKALNIEQLKLN